MDFFNCPKCGQALFKDTISCPICRTPVDLRDDAKSAQKLAHDQQECESLLSVSLPIPVAMLAASPNAGADETHAGPDAEGIIPDAPEMPRLLETAVPVQKNRTSGRDLSVMCPNCDSLGFVGPQTSSQPVKCWNPNCPIPVFIFRPVTELSANVSRAPAAGRRQPTRIFLLRVAAVVIPLVGLGVCWWLWKGGKDTRPDSGLLTDTTTVAPASAPPAATVITPVRRSPRDVDTLRTATYAALLESLHNLPPSSVASGRRLAASAAVAAGEFSEAEEHFSQLRKNAALVPYKFEAVLPITRMAWKRLKGNDDAAFAEALVAAVQASRNLPRRSRSSAQSAIALGALLAVAGRLPEAHRLVSEQEAGQELDNLAGALEVVSQDGTFNLDQAFPGQTTSRWERPLSTTVTYILMLNGKDRVAREWAKSDPDELARAEGTLLWATVTAERALASKRVAALDEAFADVGRLPAAAQACFHARLAVLYPSYEKQSEAAGALHAAQAYWAAAADTPRVVVNDVKGLLKLEPPKTTVRAELAARAGADIAVAQISLGQIDAAGASLEAALVHLRSLGPSSAALQSLEQSVLDQGDRTARDRLRGLLQLKDDRSADSALISFRRKLAELRPSAEFRLRQQEKLLLAALEWGLLNPVWKEVKARTNRPDPNDMEDFARTALPALLARRFQSSGRSELRKEVEQLQLAAQLQSASGAERLPDNPAPVIQEITNQLIVEGKIVEAAKSINGHLRDNGTLQRWTLRSACWLAQAGKFDAAVEFLSTINDAAVREEGLRLISALAAAKHSPETVFDAAGKRKKQPTEAAAMLCGLMEGLARRPPASAKPPVSNAVPATADASSSAKPPTNDK